MFFGFANVAPLFVKCIGCCETVNNQKIEMTPFEKVSMHIFSIEPLSYCAKKPYTYCKKAMKDTDGSNLQGRIEVSLPKPGEGITSM